MPESDDVLRELNGESAGLKTLKSPDAAPDAGVTVADQLEVAPPPHRHAGKPNAHVLDEKHSKAKGGHGYKVTVKGAYYAKSREAKGNVIKEYQIAFNLPHLLHPETGEAALGIIVGKLLRPALLKLDPLAVTYRTHEIVSAVPLTPETPKTNNLQYMDMAQLQAYAEEHDVPVDIESFFDVAHLRESIVDYKLTPEGFAKREEERHKQRIVDKELLDMNPELLDATVTVQAGAAAEPIAPESVPAEAPKPAPSLD